MKGYRYIPLGIQGYVLAPLGNTESFDIEATLQAQSAELEKIRALSEEDLKWRKISTYATIAGTLWGLGRLKDIWKTLRKRRAT
jgi:hypothetical protein